MKKFLLILFLVCLSVTFASCNSKEKRQVDYVVHNWNYIEHDGYKYSLSDRYGNDFKYYHIFDELSDETVLATYYSDRQESGKVKLKPYVGKIQTNFISQVKRWYSLFEPLVYGNVDNPRLDYLDTYDNVDKMSILITSNDSTTYQRGEYILPDKLSNEVWTILNEMERKDTNDSDSKWKKTDLEAWIYLYIKDVNAAVYVGILCYNTNDEICISNTNYTELYPLSSQWQDFDKLLKNCKYIENSPLN